MSQWNIGGPKVFNDSVISGSVAKREFARKRLVARSSEARRQFTVKRYWTIDCGGLMVNDEQLEEIRAFEASTRQGIDPFLVRIASYDHLENADGSASFLGTGNGTPQVFQLKKRTSYQGEVFSDAVNYPWFDYPALEDLNRDEWQPLRPLQIWQGSPTLNPYREDVGAPLYLGTEITSQCSINRLSGQITTTASGALYATGGFLWKMISLSSFGVSIEACVFKINDGVQFVEPMPDGGEVLGS